MATKSEILSSVVELGGRTDLSETMYTGQTKGDFFIEAALRLLDSAQNNPDSKRLLMKDIAVGDHTLRFQNARVIHEVWIANADGRIRLDQVDLNSLRKEYSDPVADIIPGTPKYYAPDVIQLSPEQKLLNESDYTDEFTYDYNSIMFHTSSIVPPTGSPLKSPGYKGIIWMPPTDVIYTVEILADWFSVLLSSGDSNFWSIVYPNVLVQATLFAIEVFYRNTQGMRDYLDSLRPFIEGVDFDMAEQDAMSLNQMEG